MSPVRCASVGESASRVPDVVRTGVYCRISSDREGDGLGVVGQEKKCRELAARLGWTVVDVFVDNDRSAYSGKPRKDYLRLLAAMRAGELDAVLAWHPDRLHRSPAELEEFIGVCDERRLLVQTVEAGLFDLSTPTGRAVARTVGAWARFESEHKAARVRRKMEENALAGKRGGGGARPYGYEADRLTIRENEAAVLRDLAARFLAGESLTSLARWLNDTGVSSVSGGVWSMATLRGILYSARISGQREHHGQIVADAEWPAIITTEQTARIRAVLDDPSRKSARTPRRYLLTRLVCCQRCNRPLIARPRGGQRRYVCAAPPNGYGCGRLSVIAEPLEDIVYRAVLMALDGPGLQTAIATAENVDAADAHVLAEQIATLAARRDELGVMFARGEIDRTAMLAGSRAAAADIDVLERRLAAITRTDALTHYVGDGGALAAEWADLSGDRQRAIVRSVIERVTIGPATQGRHFDPTRVDITWRY